MTAPLPRARAPLAVIVVAVLVAVIGVLDIVGGIVTIFLRYAADVAADPTTQLVVTIAGAVGILIGLFTLSMAGGLVRGRRSARVVVSVVLAFSLAVAIADAITQPGALVAHVLDALVTVAVLLALWLGPARRHFRAA